MTYSANLYRLVVEFPVKSGLPRDAVVNTLHYTGPATPADSDFDTMAATIGHFFNSTATGAPGAVKDFLGNVHDVTSNAVTVSFYLMPTGGGPTGPPVAVRHFTLGATGADTMPEEVAACLSFQGDLTGISEFGAGTRPRARRRNRIYLGPLWSGTVTQDTTTKRTKVSTSLIQSAMAAAIQYLYTEAFAASWLWMVVSPTAITNTGVFQVAMDDAFDTQRRRGPAPTARALADVV